VTACVCYNRRPKGEQALYVLVTAYAHACVLARDTTRQWPALIESARSTCAGQQTSATVGRHIERGTCGPGTAGKPTALGRGYGWALWLSLVVVANVALCAAFHQHYTAAEAQKAAIGKSTRGQCRIKAMCTGNQSRCLKAAGSGHEAVSSEEQQPYRACILAHNLNLVL
jgi:hypothetical protein